MPPQKTNRPSPVQCGCGGANHTERVRYGTSYMYQGEGTIARRDITHADLFAATLQGGYPPAAALAARQSGAEHVAPRQQRIQPGVLLRRLPPGNSQLLQTLLVG